MTDKLWQQGKLDARCRDCGEGMAATSRCYKCGSKSLSMIPHMSEGWTACLAGGGGAIGGTRDTSKARAASLAARQDPPKATLPAVQVGLGL